MREWALVTSTYSTHCVCVCVLEHPVAFHAPTNKNEFNIKKYAHMK